MVVFLSVSMPQLLNLQEGFSYRIERSVDKPIPIKLKELVLKISWIKSPLSRGQCCIRINNNYASKNLETRKEFWPIKTLKQNNTKA